MNLQFWGFFWIFFTEDDPDILMDVLDDCVLYPICYFMVKDDLDLRQIM